MAAAAQRRRRHIDARSGGADRAESKAGIQHLGPLGGSGADHRVTVGPSVRRRGQDALLVMDPEALFESGAGEGKANEVMRPVRHQNQRRATILA